jgi:hypothetical protein
MSLEEKEIVHLFAYGTLQTEAVQLTVFGRSIQEQSRLTQRASR